MDNIIKMSDFVLNAIKKKYKKYLNNCIDINQMINICSLLKDNKTTIDPIINTHSSSISINILKSEEFIKKYLFFIRISYYCIIFDIDLFDLKKEICIFNGNNKIIELFLNKKKEFINEHINILNKQNKKINMPLNKEYIEYIQKYISKINIIDKIVYNMNKLIDAGVIKNNGCLMNLILPYFYCQSNYIEEYH